MRSSRTRPADEGSAALEFLTAGVLLLVPLVYLVLALAAVQSAAYATQGAASAAVRVLSRSSADSAEEGSDRARAAAATALADFGIAADSAALDARCGPTDDCLATGGVITVTVRTEVPLPLLPAWLRGTIPLSVPVESSAALPVTRFAEPG